MCGMPRMPRMPCAMHVCRAMRRILYGARRVCQVCQVCWQGRLPVCDTTWVTKHIQYACISGQYTTGRHRTRVRAPAVITREPEREQTKPCLLECVTTSPSLVLLRYPATNR